MIIGIDASNIRGGGGLIHLYELLRIAVPEQLGISKIIVWGGTSTLNSLQDKHWLVKRSSHFLDKSLFFRTFWQRFYLPKVALNEGCDVLFVPGGSYAGDFHPVVTMSQNLLPFTLTELLCYGWSFMTVKLLLLRLSQSFSFRKAEGVIFLTDYARTAVLKVTGAISGQAKIIPHGLNPRFSHPPKSQKPLSAYSFEKPYRILYVSIIDQYKHQTQVVKAVAHLRQQGLPVVLDLIGPAYAPALKTLNKTITALDPDRHWAHYHGNIPFEDLHLHYEHADCGLFASSCENMPIILLETMASGMPIACSYKGPMPEMLGDAGVYFDSEQPADIARALLELIESPQLRSTLAQASYERTQQYSWQRCANETIKFILQIVEKYQGKVV